MSTLTGKQSSSSQPSSKSSSSFDSTSKFPISRSHLQASSTVSEDIAGSRDDYSAAISKLQKASLSDDMLSSFKREFRSLFTFLKFLFARFDLCATGLMANYSLIGTLRHSASHVSFAFWNKERSAVLCSLENVDLSAVVLLLLDNQAMTTGWSVRSFCVTKDPPLHEDTTIFLYLFFLSSFFYLLCLFCGCFSTSLGAVPCLPQ